MTLDRWSIRGGGTQATGLASHRIMGGPAHSEQTRGPSNPPALQCSAGVNETDALGERARLAKEGKGREWDEGRKLQRSRLASLLLGVPEAKKRARDTAEQRSTTGSASPGPRPPPSLLLASPSLPFPPPRELFPPSEPAPPTTTTTTTTTTNRSSAHATGPGERGEAGPGEPQSPTLRPSGWVPPPPPPAMARYWLTNGRGIAKKIRYAAHCANRQISELGAEAKRECPNCKHYIDNSDVAMEWPGLPDGVKFDPSDLQLLEHLEKKIGLGGSEPHMFIDEFIATVENDEGICYSHPENLPGMKKDGSIVHFFHRVSKAYGCGQRKRRRVITCSDHTVSDEHLRWHMTGKPKPVYDNGVTKGWKKIMVLYKTLRGGKPERVPWVMHQYHLGEDKEEKDGDLVVSKIFYQPLTKHMENVETEADDEEPDAFAAGIGPKTPKTSAPQPRRANNSPCETEPNASILLDQDEELTISIAGDDDAGNLAWCAEEREQQAVGEASRAQPGLDESLLCLEDPASLNDVTLLPIWITLFYPNAGMRCLTDIQFGSQESLGSWLDRI
ncbi:hypothetical protein EJB05_20998, partial [Eragrostis curvula]